MHRHFDPQRIRELISVYREALPKDAGIPEINKFTLRLADIAWTICSIPSYINYDESCKKSILNLKQSGNGIIISNHAHLFDVPVITDILLKYIGFDDNIFCITQKNLISSFVAEKCGGISVFRAEDLLTMGKPEIRNAIKDNKRIFSEIIPNILGSDGNYLAIFPQGERRDTDDFTMPERNLKNIYTSDTPFLLVRLMYGKETKKLKADVSVSMLFLDPSKIASFEDFKRQTDSFYS